MNKRFILIFAIVSLSFFLRIYKLNTIPNGLYSDETSLGYNAYSLLKTGKDEFGNKWPLTLKSFGDYKPPMSAWLGVPSVFVLGLNEFSVRLPSALAGSLTVLIVYFIVKEIFQDLIKKSDISKYLPEVSALLLAISPWHILFTRSNMLVGEEVMFTSSGLLFFLKGLKKPYFFILSGFSFVAAIYSYYGARITIFALLILLSIIFKKELLSMKKVLFLPILLSCLLLSPLIYSIAKNPSTLTGRAKTISIFYDQNINLKLWQAHTLDGPSYPTILSRFFNNKPYLYFNDVLMRYFQHFSLNFLVVTGDTQAPFRLEKMGVEYLPSFILFLIGLYYVIKNKTKKILALLSYLLVSPIAASFTFMTPAANRSLNLVITFNILAALGIIIVINHAKKLMGLKLATAILSTTFIISFIYFVNIYFYQIPENYPHLWHYGRKEMVKKVSNVENNYDNIIVSNSQGPAYIWFLFFNKFDPLSFSNSYKVNDVPDEFGFINVDSFNKYKFMKPFNWESVYKSEDNLYIGFENDIPDTWTGFQGGQAYVSKVIDKVFYPNGNTEFKLVQVRPI